MARIVPETFDVVMARITGRAQMATKRWSTADLQEPCVDRLAVEEAMRLYLGLRGEQTGPLRWFPDGTSARAHIRSRAPREPSPAYWPSINIARALDLAWFAGAMRPPIKIYKYCTVSARDWENWIYAVHNFNAAVGRDPALAVPSELLPIEDGFPDPPNAGQPTMPGFLAAIVSQYPVEPPPTFRAVHPERLWTPLFEAFAYGLYFFWNGLDELVCIPRPVLWLADGLLHRQDGPAVLWPSGEKHFFKHGTEVMLVDPK